MPNGRSSAIHLPTGNTGLALFWTGFEADASHKDYPAQAWVASEQASRLLTLPNWRLIISSSGNAAHAIARATLPWAGSGHIIVVTDVLSPMEMVTRLERFPHVQVVVVNDPDFTGSHAAARQKVVAGLVADNPGCFEISQYGLDGAVGGFWANGYDSLIADIEAAVPDVAAVVLPLGTCASLRSFASYKLKHQRRWKIFGVDAMGSALLGAPQGARRFSGYGNGKPTVWLEQAKALCDGFVRVPDRAVVQAALRLRTDGLWVGASSAAAVVAAQALDRKGHLPHRGRTVILCPDHGSLYVSTLYNQDFLISQGLIGVPVAPEPLLILTA